MKKILVIMIMVLLCSTAVMGQNKKRSARKPKAKTERAMTEFEKQQKEEYLTYLLVQCEKYYKYARLDSYYSEAKRYKDMYEEAKSKNYYIDFTKYHQNFYSGGYAFEIYIQTTGKAKWDGDGIDYAMCNRDNEAFKKMRREMADSLINEIQKYTGYYENLEKRKTEIDEIGDFIKTTKVEQEVSQIQNRAKQQIKEQERENWPFSETSQANRRFYQQHKSDYSKK